MLVEFPLLPKLKANLNTPLKSKKKPSARYICINPSPYTINICLKPVILYLKAFHAADKVKPLNANRIRIFHHTKVCGATTAWNINSSGHFIPCKKVSHAKNLPLLGKRE